MIARVKSHCQKKRMTLIMAIGQCPFGKLCGCGVMSMLSDPSSFIQTKQSLSCQKQSMGHHFYIMCHVTPSDLDPWAVWAAPVVWQRTLLCWGTSVLVGMLEPWGVCLKVCVWWHPHEYQDPGFPSRTLHRIKRSMLFTWLFSGFSGCDWREQPVSVYFDFTECVEIIVQSQ